MASYDSNYAHPDLRLARKVDLRWGAIFGGTLIGWGLLLLLSLLGATIGLAAIQPYSVRPGSGLDIGSAIWAAAALILSSIVGAYFVVRLAGERRKREAALHGAISWGLSMVAGALIALAAADRAALFGATLVGAGSTPARAAAENPPRTSARVDANGNLRTGRADRERLNEAKNDAAKAGGVAAASALLSLLGALLGTGLGAAASSGRRLGQRLHLGGRDRERDHLGRTSSVGAGLTTDADDRTTLSDRDRPTILPPTH